MPVDEDQTVFNFKNLYLYGGLFDIVAVGLAHVLPIDPYDLRHIICALIGIGGIGAAAATARLISGPRAAAIAAITLSTCGVWYGPMFNHTKDIPFAAAMMGATLFLIRIARSLPLPRTLDLAVLGLLTGGALGIRVLGLLLVIYAGMAVLLYLPGPQINLNRARWRFATLSTLRLLPALLLAYLLMILAWPWAALAPPTPIRGAGARSGREGGPDHQAEAARLGSAIRSQEQTGTGERTFDAAAPCNAADGPVLRHQRGLRLQSFPSSGPPKHRLGVRIPPRGQ